MSETKSDDEEMKEEIDTVKGLLGRLQHEKNKECDADEHKKESQEEVISEIHQKAVSLLINLKSPEERADEKSMNSVERMDITVDHPTDEADGSTREKVTSHKRKQDRFLVELHEKAEVISKSARTSAEGVVTKIDSAPNLEEDPEAGEFLRKIRSSETNSRTAIGDSSSREMDVEGGQTSTSPLVVKRNENMDETVKCRHTTSPVQENSEDFQKRRHTTTAVIDFSSIPSDFTINLNLDPQKSRISLVKQGALRDRRKPSAANRRSRPTSLLLFDGSYSDEAIEEENEKMETSPSGLKPSPLIGPGEGLKPRVAPKPKVKSKTVAGIALPGLAEAIHARQLKKTEVTKKVTAAELVKGAKIDKEKQAVKEERVEKMPQKPAWLLEAEARRKHHDRRRSQKAKAEVSSTSSTTTMSSVTIPLSSSLGHVMISHGLRDEPVEKVKATFSLPLFGKEKQPVKHGTSELSATEETKDASTVSLASPKETKDASIVSLASPKETKDASIVSLASPKEPVERDQNKRSVEATSTVKIPQIIHEISASDRSTESKPAAEIWTHPVATSDLKPRKLTSITVASKKSEEELIIKAKPEKCEENTICVSPTSVSSYKLLDFSAEEIQSPSPVSPMSPRSPHSISPVGSPMRVPSSPTKVTVNGSTIQQAEIPAKVSTVNARPTPKPKPKPKPKPVIASKTVTVKAGEISPYKSLQKADMQTSHHRVEPTNSGHARPVGTLVAHSNHLESVSPAREGDDKHDYGDYRPVVTGEVLPQWKKELLQRKRTSKEYIYQSHAEPEQHVTELVVVPKWKRELMERRKFGQRDHPAPSTEPKSPTASRTDTTVDPPWLRELNERKKRVTTAPAKVAAEDGNVSEIRKKLSEMRHRPVIIIPQKTEDVDIKPSFMKEFEKKKRVHARVAINPMRQSPTMRGTPSVQRASAKSYV